MPSLELTIEDNSPIISYSSNWSPGLSADPLLDQYSRSAFTLTNLSGESVSFSFNGTGVQVFGSKRGNHGPYHVNFDSGTATALNGKAADPGEFQTSLFSITGLQQGLHQFTLTNDGASYLDIDFITWQTDMGNSSDQIRVITFQDSHPSFVYSPSSSVWTTNPENLGTFFGGSGHATNNSGASFTYTFTVSWYFISSQAIYGPNGSSYGVQMDGRPSTTMSSVQRFYAPQTILYHANNLEPGLHHLELQCQAASSTQMCAIDYANVYTTSPSSTESPSPETRSLSNVALVGITVACVVSLFVLLGLLFRFFRSNARRRRLGLGLGSNPHNPSFTALASSESTVRLGTSQMTTVPNPFYLSSPPPTRDILPGASQQPRKGQVRFLPNEVTQEYPSSSASDSSFFPVNAPNPNPIQIPVSRSTRPRFLNMIRTPVTPGDTLPPGYSA